MLDVNDGACESLGYTREELLDRRYFEIDPTISSRIGWEEFLTRLRKERSITEEGYHQKQNGTRLPVEVDADLVEDGAQEYLLFVSRPLDDRDGAAPGRDDRLRFQSLFENHSVPCCIFDLSAVRDYVESKFSFEDFVGSGTLDFDERTLEECVDLAESFGTNEAFSELVHQGHSTRGPVNLLRHLPLPDIEPLLRSLIEGQNHFQFKTKLNVAGERDIPIALEVTLAPGYEHRWGRVYFTVRDISERRKIKKRLSRSERTFQQITNQIEQIVWMFDARMEKLLYHSGPVEDIYGCTPEAIQRDSEILLKMVHPEDRNKVQTMIDDMIDGRSVDVEYRVNPHENYERWAWTQGIPLMDETSNVERIAGFTKDITNRKRMEFSLRKSKERYQAIFEQAQVGMAEISIDGQWLRINSRLSDILGYSKNELYQMTWNSITHPEDVDEDRRYARKLLKGEINNYTLEKRFYRKNGDPIWIKHTTSLVRDESNEPLYFISIIEDVQEQRQAEVKLKRREERYRNLVSDVPGIVYRCKLDDDWTMLFMSDNVEDIIGYPRDDFIDSSQRTFASVIHPEDRTRVRQVVENAVERGDPFEIEYRLRTRDGDDRWVLERGRAIEDGEKETDVLHGVIVDVTDIKKAQQELEESEERYRSVFEQAKVGLAEVSFDEEWLSVNERLQSILGYSEEELVGSTCPELTHPDDVDEVRRSAEEVIEGSRDHFTVEKRYRHKEGHWVWVRMTVSRVDSSRAGRDGYFVAIVEDISDQKKAQRQLERSEKRFRKLAETINQVFWIFDTRDRSLQYLGPGLESIWGRSPENVTRFPDDLVEIVSPDNRDSFRELLLSTDGYERQLEFQINRPDGETRWVRLRAFPFGEDGDDSRLIAGTFEDITERKTAEQELRKSEQRFRSTFEQAAVGMAYVDIDGSLLRVNEKFCQLLGYSASELKDKKFHDITHPEDLDSGLEILRKLKQGEQNQYSMEKRYVRKDDSIFWAQLTVGIVRDEEGAPEYFVSVIEDISERKKTEQELRRSEEKFRELAENVDEVFWLTDPSKNEILYASSAFEDIWDIPLEDLYENPDLWLERVHPEDQSRVRKDLIERQKQGTYEEEYRIVLPDDSIRWIHDRAFPIEDEDGNVHRIAGIAEDITREKRVQEEQETFFNLSLDLFALADYEGQYLDVNPAFSEVLGYSRSELTSRPFVEFVHPEDKEKTIQQMQKLQEDKPVKGFENRYITKDGKVRWLSWRAEPGEDMIYAVARDVTERRRYEQKLQAMIDEKEALLKEIHHRVKNNLQMVSSMLDMQMREIDQESVLEKLRDSVNRIKSMALIHEKLYQSENLADLDFKRYVQELTQRTMNIHKTSPDNIKLEFDVDSEPLELDHAIPCGLVLNELISNAMEHGFRNQKEGRIRIVFRNGPHKARLRVRDNGRGFEPDFDIDETETFGMQIVKSLVEYELDGTVTTYNDSGAVVDISFPT